MDGLAMALHCVYNNTDFKTTVPIGDIDCRGLRVVRLLRLMFLVVQNARVVLLTRAQEVLEGPVRSLLVAVQRPARRWRTRSTCSATRTPLGPSAGRSRARSTGPVGSERRVYVYLFAQMS